MFLDSTLGAISEPLTARRWDRQEILRQISRRFAYYVSRGLSRGDRVFLHYGNRLEFFVDLLAIWKAGACAIPIDQRLTPFEVQTLARAARPRFSLWCTEPDPSIPVEPLDSRAAAAHAIELPAAPDPLFLEQDALILFTSGTTGQPKGVVHTHRSLLARWITLRHSLGIERFRRTFCLLPTHFGHGLICNCLYPWLSGCDLFIVPPFQTDVVTGLGRLLDEYDITFLSSVPSVWRLALKAARPPSKRTVERIFCGSAPLSAQIWEQIREWSGSPEVMNSYGITETGSWVAGTSVGPVPAEDGLIGVGWGSIVKILKTGSTAVAPAEADECASGQSGYVWLNTPALMKGYFQRDDLTAQVVRDGWFVTGDIGRIDARGYLYLCGREREEINKGGMKVYPGDIDAVVEQFESTVDVCTFPYEDAFYGQDIAMAVVLKSRDDRMLQALYQFMRQRLAAHKMPTRWFVVESIARTSRGKLNRSSVSESCAALEPVDLRRILGTQ